MIIFIFGNVSTISVSNILGNSALFFPAGNITMPSLMADPAQNMQFMAIDNQLQPLAPNPASPESMAIFEKHCQVCTLLVNN